MTCGGNEKLMKSFLQGQVDQRTPGGGFIGADQSWSETLIRDQKLIRSWSEDTRWRVEEGCRQRQSSRRNSTPPGRRWPWPFFITTINTINIFVQLWTIDIFWWLFIRTINIGGWDFLLKRWFSRFQSQGSPRPECASFSRCEGELRKIFIFVV